MINEIKTNNWENKYGLAGAFVKAHLEAGKAEAEEWARKAAMGHTHNNVLGEFVQRGVYVFGIKNGYLKKCECGKTLVLKKRWANGKIIKVKTE